MSSVKNCHGNEHRQFHARGCRPARPLCRLRRRLRENRRVCVCDAYLFPHRHGSGVCGRFLQAMLARNDDMKEWAEIERSAKRARGG